MRSTDVGCVVFIVETVSKAAVERSRIFGIALK